MKAGWEVWPPGEVCEVLDSPRNPITKRDRLPGPYPYFGATGELDQVAEYIFDEPLVLLGEDGAKWGAGERSAFRISGKVWVNNHARVIRLARSRLPDAEGRLRPSAAADGRAAREPDPDGGARRAGSGLFDAVPTASADRGQIPDRRSGKPLNLHRQHGGRALGATRSCARRDISAGHFGRSGPATMSEVGSRHEEDRKIVRGTVFPTIG